MNVKQLFLTQKESEHQGTLAVYAKIPRDRLDWRPAPGMLSLGQIARHAWRSEDGNRRIALEGDWSYYETRIPQDLLAILGEVKSLDEELQELRRAHQETLRAAEAFPLERWEEIRENTRFHTHRPVGVILFRIIEHQVHHRAQVGTYLHILTGGRTSPYEV
jgi:uncharacterized damage-inducible protein DinB